MHFCSAAYTRETNSKLFAQ